MAIVVYPLNDIDFTAEDVGIYNATRTSGIYAGEDFAISMTGADNTISIDVGLAWMRLSRFFGVAVALKNKVFVDLGIPDSVYSRIDAVVLQFDANKNGAEVVVKFGSASSNPSPPAVSRTEALYELHLLHVLRKPGAASITAADVTDLRLNEQYCGLMADAVTRVDTAAIDSQITALIEELREDLEAVEAQTYYASKEYVQEQVRQAASKEYVQEQVRKAAPRNLLDNSDFTHPVNQRGKTSYTGSGYTIDRWRAYHADTTHAVTSSGLAVSSTSSNANLYQVLDADKIDVNRVMTAACCDTDGNVYVWSGVPSGSVLTTVCVYKNNSDYLFRIISGGYEVTWKWAALYYGEYTVDTLPEYQPKEYGLELAECQRFAVPIGGLFRYRASQVSYDIIDFSIALPSTLRVTPSVDLSKLKVYSQANRASSEQTGFTLSVVGVFANGIVIRATKSSHGINDAFLDVSAGTILSSDL